MRTSSSFALLDAGSHAAARRAYRRYVGAMARIGSVDASSIVTGIEPGFGLTGGGSGGDLTVAVDPNVVQRKIVGDCGPNDAIESIRDDGLAICNELGIDSTLSAGIVESEGSHDADLCDWDEQGGPFVEHELVSERRSRGRHLSPGARWPGDGGLLLAGPLRGP